MVGLGCYFRQAEPCPKNFSRCNGLAIRRYVIVKFPDPTLIRQLRYNSQQAHTVASGYPQSNMQDIENRIRGQKREDELDEQPDYQPTNWRKVVLSWKFFGTPVGV